MLFPVHSPQSKVTKEKSDPLTPCCYFVPAAELKAGLLSLRTVCIWEKSLLRDCPGPYISLVTCRYGLQPLHTSSTFWVVTTKILWSHCLMSPWRIWDKTIFFFSLSVLEWPAQFYSHFSLWQLPVLLCTNQPSGNYSRAFIACSITFVLSMSSMSSIFLLPFRTYPFPYNFLHIFLYFYCRCFMWCGEEERWQSWEKSLLIFHFTHLRYAWRFRIDISLF